MYKKTTTIYNPNPLTVISNLIWTVLGKKSTNGKSKSKLNFSVQKDTNAAETEKKHTV